SMKSSTLGILQALRRNNSEVKQQTTRIPIQ
ncbi:MAG: hypothetical protein ACI9WU_004151, partial [Myxococcota bacterium]